MTNAVNKFFMASLYFGVIGVFASTSAIAVHHLFALIAIALFFYGKGLTASWRKIIVEQKSALYLVLFTCSIALSVLLNFESIDRPLKWLLKFKYFLIPLLMIPLMREIRISKDAWSRFFYFSFVVVLVADLAGFWGYKFGYNFLKPSGSSTPNRLSGLNGMVLTYAHNLSFFNILLLGYIFYFKDLSKKIYLNYKVCVFVFTANLICLYLSSTRGAWLSFIFSIPFLFLFKVSLRKWLIICSLTTISFFGALKISKLDKEFIGEKRMNSNTQRIAFFQAAYESFREHPLFGIGYKQFEFNSLNIKKRHSIEWQNQSGHAHNNFLEHLASLGIFGALSFLMFSIFWFFESIKIRESQRYLTQSFCVCVGISGLTQYTFGDAENSVFIMLVWLLTVREGLIRRAAEVN